MAEVEGGENPSGASDFSFDDVEEAMMYLQGYCEMASDTLQSMREQFGKLNQATQDLKDLVEKIEKDAQG